MSPGPRTQGAAVENAPLRAPHRLALGLRMLADPREWLVVDADREPDLHEKRRLHRERADQVWVELPASRPAQREVLETVTAHLERHHPDVSVPRLPDEPPLLAASLGVQEDLCLMERSAGAWRLSAASVCFPTRWDLPSKLGQSLTDLHDPVPGYRAELAGPAERFFDGLRPGRIAVRANWSIVDDPALFQPARGNRSGRTFAPDAVAEHVWLRVERQTLRRLPDTGAVLFTIRVLRDPLGRLADHPGRAELLAADLRSLPDGLARYKSIPDMRDAVLAWLEGVTSA